MSKGDRIAFRKPGEGAAESELVRRMFTESGFQRCLVHVLRNMNSKVRPKDRAELSEDFNAVRGSADRKEAKEKFEDFSLKWDRKYKSLRLWSLCRDELFTFMDFPA